MEHHLAEKAEQEFAMRRRRRPSLRLAMRSRINGDERM